MSNIFKKLMIVFMLSLLTLFAVNALENRNGEPSGDDFENYDYIEEAKLMSSRYTKPDDLSIVDPSDFVDIRLSDELVAENDAFELYYDEDIVSFKVLNKATGYVWSTAINNASAGTFSGLLSSGVGFEYILIEKDMFVEKNIGIGDTVFNADVALIDQGIQISIDVEGYCATRRCKNLYPLFLEGRYTLEEMVEIGFAELDLGFDLIVKLTDTGITAEVPLESIVEPDPDTLVVSSIIIFPALGATEMDEIPGYMVIPDGAGALIRYEDNEGQYLAPFEEMFFGRNYGLDNLTQSVANYPLSMPIFGAVHGVNQNAFVGIIEEGMLSARLFAYPNGALNIPYNLIFTKFDIRSVYRQSFSSDGSGGAMKNIETSTSDIKIRYNFLDGDDANYVGIGKNYRQYLEAQAVLDQLNQSGDIEIYLRYLMSDNETSFFGSSLVEMSTVDQVKEMYDFFMSQGLTRQNVALMGWNNGGYSGYLPANVNFENALGSNRKYRDLIEHINQENFVMLMNDYMFATDDTPGISYRVDVAKGSNRFKMAFTRDSFVHDQHYVLYPLVTKSLALGDLEDYRNEEVQVLFESLGSVLFSYYDDEHYYREDSFAIYRDILSEYADIGHYYYPFSYAYQYVNGFYGAPLYNSQLKYYDDIVPLLQVVLVGSIDLFADDLNFNSLGRETLLNIIDYGMNPAFVLSYEPSSKLKDTDLDALYTTEFDLWKDTVVLEYHYINDALKHVNGARIDQRVVLDYGVVKVSYDNGVDIYVNYTSQEFTAGGITIPAFDYALGGVS